MYQYSREFIAEKARLRPEDLGLVRTARRSHNQLRVAPTFVLKYNLLSLAK